MVQSYDALQSTNSSVTVDNSIIEFGSSRDGAGLAVKFATFTAPGVYLSQCFQFRVQIPFVQ